MVQKYKNEIAPIFYYGISTKTNEKDLKMPNLQPPDWKSPYWMTLYILFWILIDNIPAILRHHQRASRVSLAGVLDIVAVTGADVEAK